MVIQWLFRRQADGGGLVAADPVAGVAASHGAHPEPNTPAASAAAAPPPPPHDAGVSVFYRTLQRFFPLARGPEVDAPATATHHDGLVAVTGTAGTLRCRATHFAAQAEPVVSASSSSSAAETAAAAAATVPSDTNGNIAAHAGNVTFVISCASPASAEHGVLVGLAPPGAKQDTPMLWDEPSTILVNCASTGATLWSSSHHIFGERVADRCLEPVVVVAPPAVRGAQDSDVELATQATRYVGRVRVLWNESGVRFTVLSGHGVRLADEAPADPAAGDAPPRQHGELVVRDLASEHSREPRLVPTVAFTTALPDDAVTLT